MHIVHYNSVAFILFVLQKYFDTPYKPFLTIFLCFFGIVNLLDIFIYEKNYYKKVKHYLKNRCFWGFLKEIVTVFENYFGSIFFSQYTMMKKWVCLKKHGSKKSQKY